MKRSYVTLIALLGLWILVVLPANLHAQVVKDCGEGMCSAEDIVQGLLRSPETKTRGVGKISKPAVSLQVQFATNSDAILPQYRATLTELGKALTRPELAPYRFEIQGHTDNVGSDQQNERLSQKRAESVKRYLVQNFAPLSGRLTAAGYGKKEPIAPNDTPEGRSKNRRVQVVNLGQ